jgi:hypothetical protein
MAQTLLVRSQDGKIRALEETLESWEGADESALVALNVEDLIAECLSGWEAVRRAWGRTRRLATQNRLPDLQEAGKSMRDLVERWIRLLREVDRVAGKLGRDTGDAIEGRDLLPEAAREARGLLDYLQKTWPWADSPALPLDRKMVEESRAARARGESCDVTALVRSLVHPYRFPSD